MEFVLADAVSPTLVDMIPSKNAVMTISPLAVLAAGEMMNVLLLPQPLLRVYVKSCPLISSMVNVFMDADCPKMASTCP